MVWEPYKTPRHKKSHTKLPKYSNTKYPTKIPKKIPTQKYQSIVTQKIQQKIQKKIPTQKCKLRWYPHIYYYSGKGSQATIQVKVIAT